LPIISPARDSWADPAVSVIVRAYKEAEYVEETLGSVAKAFRYAKLTVEIIVVIDWVLGDETAMLVERAPRVFPRSP